MVLTWSAREQGICDAVHKVQEGIMRSALRNISFCQMSVKTGGYELKYLFPVHCHLSPGTMENAIFDHNKEIKFLKAVFFLLYHRILLKLLKGPNVGSIVWYNVSISIDL